MKLAFGIVPETVVDLVIRSPRCNVVLEHLAVASGKVHELLDTGSVHKEEGVGRDVVPLH